MAVTIVHPGNESVPKAATPPARLKSLVGKKIGLLDISKPGGSFFLDRLEEILRTKYGAAEIVRNNRKKFILNHVTIFKHHVLFINNFILCFYFVVDTLEINQSAANNKYPNH